MVQLAILLGFMSLTLFIRQIKFSLVRLAFRGMRWCVDHNQFMKA